MPLADKKTFTQITKDNFNEIFLYVNPVGIGNLTLHWSVSRYPDLFDDYHFCILGDGTIWLNNLGWDEKGKHIPLNHLGHGDQIDFDKLSHTWMRNTGNIGISWSAMLGATESNYGQFPPTSEQKESMSWLVAMLMKVFKLPSYRVKSHYQFAVEDGYYPDRWDLKNERDLIVERALEIYLQDKS